MSTSSSIHTRCRFPFFYPTGPDIYGDMPSLVVCSPSSMALLHGQRLVTGTFTPKTRSSPLPLDSPVKVHSYSIRPGLCSQALFFPENRERKVPDGRFPI